MEELFLAFFYSMRRFLATKQIMSSHRNFPSSSSTAASNAGEEMIIMPLGGGQEVGRSCILLKYQGRTIMLDCGCHPGREGSDSLPFFDSIDNPEEIDLILITHFHIDHCAALPYFTEHTNFKGKVYMTHATKAVMRLLLSDNIRLQSRLPPLYTEQELQNCIDKIDVIDFHQTVEYKGIKFTPTAAGHVLGAAMFTIDIDNIRVLYTGDYSLEEDRHLSQAEIPPGGPPDVMIVESTFGTTSVPPRHTREVAFTNAVETIVTRGGCCLIPVFALGRAQELLLILDDYWKRHAHLQAIPVFYASKLATRSLRVYQTFANMMNAAVQQAAGRFENPFALQHIRSLPALDLHALPGNGAPAVVFASPGFLQSGMSRQLFELWCDDDKHGVIIAGYTIEGTLAHALLSAPATVQCLDNRIKPRRCSIDYISFSAHVDYQQNQRFIKSILPDNIVLVHGEKTQMKRLKDALEAEIRSHWPGVAAGGHRPNVAMPENGVNVRLRFKKHVVAQVAGSANTALLQALDGAAVAAGAEAQVASGVALPPHAVLVTEENFTSQVVTVDELAQHTPCRFGTLAQRLVLPLPAALLALYTAYAFQLALELDEDEAPARRRQCGLVGLVRHSLQEHLALLYDDLADESDACTSEGVSATPEGVQEQTLCVQRLVRVTVRSAEASASGGAGGAGGGGGAGVSVVLRWVASRVADVVADSLTGILLQYFSTTHLVKRSLQDHYHQLTASDADNKHRYYHLKQSHRRPKKPRAVASGNPDDEEAAVAPGNESVPSGDTDMPLWYADFVAKLRAGEIDPRRVISVPFAAPDSPPDSTAEEVARRKSLLAQVQAQVEAAHPGVFAQVALNAAGDRLVFRGAAGQAYHWDEDAQELSFSPRAPPLATPHAEAFVFILFDHHTSSAEQRQTHHAAVQSEEEDFRRFISWVLSTL